ncbi:MAG: hypothetical protein ACLQQ4_14980 [Bacteroidia bacterium]
MQNLKIFLTYDHELPLGRLNTSFEKAMFEPTYKVMQLAEELQVRVTLFTDVLCALRFKEWDKEGFYMPYINQLKTAIAKGHDVQLHLHPHWLTSDFINGSVRPSDDFKLADFAGKEYPHNIPGIIETGISFLKSVCSEANADYKCIAYRGGGYSIAPESDKIFTGLYENGIRYDSSVCKGYYFKSSISEVNYKNVPSVPNWFIGSNGNYNSISDNGILEIPIAGKPKSLLEIPTRFKMKKYGDRAPENHGIQIHTSNPVGLIYKFRQALSSRMLNFDNYTYSVSYLMDILDYHTRKYSNHETIMLSAIAHPKSMGDYSFQLMKGFIEQTREKYGEKVQFCTYQQIFNEQKHT